jgi:hypothetical protein
MGERKLKLKDTVLVIYDKFYLDDFIENFSKLSSAKDKTQYLMEVTKNPKVLKLFKNLQNPINLEANINKEYLDRSNFPGASAEELVERMPTQFNRLAQLYDFLGCLTEAEYYAYLDYISGKPFKLKGLTKKILVDAGILGKEISVESKEST